MSQHPNNSPLPTRHAWGAAFWGVLTLVIFGLNFFLLGLPGYIFFSLGDTWAQAILGPTILPDFHSERLAEISLLMGFAWPVGAAILWASFACYGWDEVWSIGKLGLFLAALLAWTVGLSVFFHLGAVSADARLRSLQPKPELLELAQRGDLEGVKALIAGGAKVDVRKDCLATPLMAAAEAGHAQIVEVLLQAGARVDFRGSCQMHWSLLCIAAAGGSLETVRMLHQRGVPLNEFDSSGGTPLMCAAGVGNLEVMKFLLENGADIHAGGSNPNTSSPPFDTALMHAAMRGRSQATQLLLERGARVNEKGRLGFTALAYAAQGGRFPGEPGISAQDYPGTVRILLQHGADPSIKDEMGGTALHYARTRGIPEIIELLETGAPRPGIPAETPAVVPPKETGTPRPVEATVVARKDCTIRCTLQDEKYSLYASERCLYTHKPEEPEESDQCLVKLAHEKYSLYASKRCLITHRPYKLEKFIHQCIVELERQQNLQERARRQ